MRSGSSYRMKADWPLLVGATFDRTDRQWRDWSADASGMYVSNGAAISVAKHSPGAKGPRDLFFMALLAKFRGYERATQRRSARTTTTSPGRC